MKRYWKQKTIMLRKLKRRAAREKGEKMKAVGKDIKQKLQEVKSILWTDFSNDLRQSYAGDKLLC